jgi:hypothetical protein|tara:strand:- start:149 stop:901 length:753 start_codon:yes stop_codon:yes gene_type:complete
MAIEPTSVTQQLTSPILEGSLTAFLKSLDPLMGQQINTGSYAPQIAAESALQQQARTAAGGLGSLVGPNAYQAYMSPYQQEVMDTTMSEYDRQAAIQRQGIGQQAIQSGAFGGGREGVQLAEYDTGTAAKRAMSMANLLNQGYNQAQTQAASQLQAQQGLGTYQTQLGQAGQAQQQAILDASTVAAKESTFEPFTRLGLVGQQLAQIQPGAFPSQSVGYQQPQAPVSPLSTALGVGTGIASIGNKLGLFG